MADFWEHVEQVNKRLGTTETPTDVEGLKTPTAPKGEPHLIGAVKHTALQFGRSVGGTMGLIGRVIPGEDFMDRAYQIHNKYYDDMIQKDPDTRGWVESVNAGTEPFVGEWLGSMGPTAASYAFGLIPVVGTPLAISTFYALNEDETYQAALAKGADEKTARMVGYVGGTINTLLDFPGFEGFLRIFKGKAFGNLLVNIGMAAVLEGVPEGIQGVVTHVGSEWAKAQKEGVTLGQFSERMVAQRDQLWSIAKHDAMIGGATGAFFGAGAHVARDFKQSGLDRARVAKEEEEKLRNKPIADAVKESTIIPRGDGKPEWLKFQEKADELDKRVEGEAEIRGVEAKKPPVWQQFQEGAEKVEGKIEGIKKMPVPLTLKEQAAVRAQEYIDSLPEMKRINLMLKKIRGNMDLLGRSANHAITRGREPSARITSALEKATAQERFLQQKKDETFANYHERIIGDMKREMELDERQKELLKGGEVGQGATLIEGEPKPAEDKLLVKPTENFLEQAQRRVGGTPGVREISPEEQEVMRAFKAPPDRLANIGKAEEPLIVTPGVSAGPRGQAHILDMVAQESLTPKEAMQYHLNEMLSARQEGEHGNFNELFQDAKRSLYDFLRERGWSERKAGKVLKLTPKTFGAFKKAFEGGVVGQTARFGIEQEPPEAKELGIRYDGPWKGLGHSWTDLATGGSFTTKTFGKAEIKGKVDALREAFKAKGGGAKFGLSTQAVNEQMARASIQPNEDVGGITREEAGKMLASGDSKVLEYIARGVKEYGPLPMQDAIRNEMLRVLRFTRGMGEKQKVIGNYKELYPRVNEIIGAVISPGDEAHFALSPVSYPKLSKRGTVWAGKMADMFTLTDDFTEANFILPDGKLVRLPKAVGNWGRLLHEEAVAEIIAEEFRGKPSDMLIRFMEESGTIRMGFSGEDLLIDIIGQLTPAQETRLGKVIKELRRIDADIILDVSDNQGRIVASEEIGYPLSVEKVKQVISKAYSQGNEARFALERKAFPSVEEQDARFAFGGEQAIGHPEGALKMAKAMQIAGHSEEDIWQGTGWWLGPEGKWRFEIDDSGMEVDLDALNSIPEIPMFGKGEDIVYAAKLEDVVKHPLLYKYYKPQLKEFTVIRKPILFDFMQSTQASYNMEEKIINIPPYSNMDNIRQSFMHELMHGIQHIEGFIEGANTGKAKVWQAVTSASEGLVRRFGDDIANRTRAELRRFALKLDKVVADQGLLRAMSLKAKTEFNELTEDYRRITKDIDRARELWKQGVRNEDITENKFGFGATVAYGRLSNEAKEIEVRKVELMRGEKPGRFDFDIRKAGSNEIAPNKIAELEAKLEGDKIVYENGVKGAEKFLSDYANADFEDVAKIVAEAKAHEIYKLVFGEVEAREVEERIDMDVAFRGATFPTWQGIPRGDWIILPNEAGGTSFKVEAVDAGLAQKVNKIGGRIEKIASKWKGAPAIRVLNGIEGVSQAERDIFDASLPGWDKANPKGVFFFKEGKPNVYIFANALHNEEDAQYWLIHEVVGHYGFHGAFGDAVNPILDRVWMSYGGSEQMAPIINTYFRNEAGEVTFDAKNVEHRRLASEELLAKISSSDVNPTLMDRLISIFRNILRGMGFNVKLGDAEIRSILQKSKSFIESGRDVTGKEAARFAGRGQPVPWTYSNLAKVVEDPNMPAKVQSLRNWLIKKQVKQAEMGWMGVDQWLADNTVDGRVDREAFKDFVKSNQIVVQEVVKGGVIKEETMPLLEKLTINQREIAINEAYRRYLLAGNDAKEYFSAMTDMLRLSTSIPDSWQKNSNEDINTKLAQDQNVLPDEILRQYLIDIGIAIPKGDEGALSMTIIPTDYSEYTEPGGKGYKELLLTIPKATSEEQGGYYGDHWPDTGNVAVHVRFDERKGANGEKILYIDEVQSDWAADIGRYGISGGKIYPEDKGMFDMPFKGVYDELAMKRMLRWASEHGFDVLAWSTAETQVKRWGSDRFMWKRWGEADVKAVEGRYEIRKQDRPSVGGGDFVIWDNNVNQRLREYRLAQRAGGKEVVQGSKGEMQQWVDAGIQAAKSKVGLTQLTYQRQFGGHVRGFDLQAEAERLAGEGKFSSTKSKMVNSLEDVREFVDSISEWRDYSPEWKQRRANTIWGKIKKSPESGAHLPRKEGMEMGYDKKLTGFMEKFVKQWGGKVEEIAAGDETVQTPQHERYYLLDENNELWRPFPSYNEAQSELDFQKDIGKPVGQWRIVDTWEPGAFREVLHGGSGEPMLLRPPMHTVTITPSMRDSAIYEGYAMFALQPLPESINKYIGRSHKTLGEHFNDGMDAIKSKEFWDRKATKLFDRLHPIKVHLGTTPYKLHRMMNGSYSALDMMMRHGKLYFDQGGLLNCDERKKGFVPWLHSLGDDANKFLVWAIARRAEVLEQQFVKVRDPETGALMERPKELLLTALKRQEIYDWVGGRDNPMLAGRGAEEWMQELDSYNKSVLDIAVKAGIINAKARGDWEQYYYIPFYRLMEDVEGWNEFLLAPDKSLRYISAGIKRLVGSENKLGDPLENILKNWMHLISESLRNVARAEAFDSGVAKGIMEEVGFKDLHYFRQGKGDKARYVYITNKDARNVLVFQRDGKPVYFKTDSVELFDALSGFNVKYLDGFLKWILVEPKQLLTYGATFGPAFRVANLLRDTMHTAAIEKTFRPFVDSAKGFMKAWNETPEMISLMAAGGGIGASYVKSSDPRVAAKYIQKIVNKEGAGAGMRVLYTLKKGLDFWDHIGHASENAARVQLYAKKMGAGRSHLDAAFDARDLLDFSMKGSSNFVQFAIQTIPFLNARMQGLYRLGRAVGQEETRNHFFVYGGALMLASMGLWAFYKDDDRYKQLEDWDKWTYYHWWIGDMHFRGPKPFEFGAFFSSLPETIANVMNGNEETKHIGNFVWSTFTQTFAMDTPQIIKPLLEQWANKSFFTGRPIVGEHLRGLIPKEQHDPWTSSTAKVAGMILAKVPKLKEVASPNRVEALVNSYLSVFGMALLGAVDVLAENVGTFPEEPTKRLDDYPLIGRFLKEAKNPRYVKSQTDLYDVFSNYDQIAKTMSHYRALGNAQDALELARENKRLVQIGEGFKGVRNELKNIRSNMRLIYQSGMEPDEKKRRLDKFIQRRNELVERAYKIVKQKLNE